MAHAFCTLFDINYLPRGLVLYRSLARTCASFRLWIFCMDSRAEAALRRLDLPSVTIVPLTQLERHDLALLGTKGDRTQVEYCWTATPAVCRFVLETEPGVDEVTYLDADLRFFSDPQPLFDELGDDAVLIVPHRYAPEYRHKEVTSGTLQCRVAHVPARRRWAGGVALVARALHRVVLLPLGRRKARRPEVPRRLPPAVFACARAQHLGGGLAPWNVANHELTERDGQVLVDGEPLVFYHHHSLRLFRRTVTSRLAVTSGRLRPGVPPVPLDWTTNYPVGDAELAPRLAAVPSRTW